MKHGIDKCFCVHLIERASCIGHKASRSGRREISLEASKVACDQGVCEYTLQPCCFCSIVIYCQMLSFTEVKLPSIVFMCEQYKLYTFQQFSVSSDKTFIRVFFSKMGHQIMVCQRVDVSWIVNLRVLFHWPDKDGFQTSVLLVLDFFSLIFDYCLHLRVVSLVIALGFSTATKCKIGISYFSPHRIYNSYFPLLTIVSGFRPDTPKLLRYFALKEFVCWYYN